MPVFIAEITARAFIIADSNKRRTLSRADIAKAVSKSDQFDFLIDILPREEPFPGTSVAAGASGTASGSGKGKKAAKQTSVSRGHAFTSPSDLGDTRAQKQGTVSRDEPQGEAGNTPAGLDQVR